MACSGYVETVISREPKERLVEVSTSYPNSANTNSVIFGERAPGNAQQASQPWSSLFNHGDPDLSFCDVLAADVSEIESDQPSTVDVEKFTDLMLFPELMDVFEVLPAFQDVPIDPLGGVDEPLKPREPILSVASVTTSDGGEVSPAESDASVEHFFNTFTDLTGFLQQFTEEAGPTDLNDLAASIAESNAPLTTDAESSAMATTIPPTPVGSETASLKVECPDHRYASPSTDNTDVPPAKKARTSHCKRSATQAKVKYRQRRDKNNLASQRSRATRRQRESGMAVQVQDLEADNARLRVRIDELASIAEEARKCLVVALTQK